MKEIKLTRGLIALIDDEDFDRINKYKWHASQLHRNTHYAIANISKGNGKQVLCKMHRLIMGCTKGDGKMIDHIDGNGLNCQKSNLRLATSAQNQYNRKAWGSSKYLGVSKKTTKNRWKRLDGTFGESISISWVANISTNNIATRIGYFRTEIEAAIAYNNAAKIHHGEFARLNEV